MPLYAPKGKIRMTESFDYMVGRKLYIADMLPRQVYALMVGTVDKKVLSVKTVQKRTFCGGGFMYLVFSVILMKLTGGKVLKQIASKININELHSFADTKYRFPVRNKAFQYGKLKPVKTRLNAAGAMI